MRMLLLSALLATTISCGTETSPASRPFAGITADGRITIEKPALGRTLALTRTYALGTSIEETNPLRTLLVYFERVDGPSIAMKEIRDGTTTPSKSDRTLATFPAEVSGNTMTFDFNNGMQKAYLEFAVYEWWKEPRELIFDITQGNIRGIRMVDDALVIDRDETVNVPGAGALDVTLKYALAEYKPAQDFEPRQNNKVNGFYVNAPVPRGGHSALRSGCLATRSTRRAFSRRSQWCASASRASVSSSRATRASPACRRRGQRVSRGARSSPRSAGCTPSSSSRSHPRRTGISIRLSSSRCCSTC